MSPHQKAQLSRWIRLSAATFVVSIPLSGPLNRHAFAAAALATAEVLLRQWNKTVPAAVDAGHEQVPEVSEG